MNSGRLALECVVNHHAKLLKLCGKIRMLNKGMKESLKNNSLNQNKDQKFLRKELMWNRSRWSLLTNHVTFGKSLKLSKTQFLTCKMKKRIIWSLGAVPTSKWLYEFKHSIFSLSLSILSEEFMHSINTYGQLLCSRLCSKYQECSNEHNGQRWNWRGYGKKKYWIV